MRTITKIASAAALALAWMMTSSAFAQTPPAGVSGPAPATIASKPGTKNGRYSREEEGWFWYKQEPEPPPPPPEKKPEPAAAAGEPPKHKPLSAEWLRDNLDKYRFLAIDNPTKDNMEM